MKQTEKLPAVSGTPSSQRRSPMRRPRVRAGVKTGNPRASRARPAPWDPEPIFHSLVDELHFDPQAVL